jgi:hypothetical protein
MFKLNLRPFMDEESSVGGGAAAPQGTESTAQTESTGEPTGGATGTATVTDPPSQARQTPEQNAAFAELRRRSEAAERRVAEVEAQRQRDREIARKYGKDYGIYSDDDVAAQYGQSHGLTTVEEFEAALQRQEYQARGVDTDLIDQLVNNHPAIQAAKQQQGQVIIDREIAELAGEYPELGIKTLNDMRALPNFEAIKAKAYKGMTLLEAYEAVNRAEIRQRAKEEGSQQAIRNIGSKAHLGTEKSGNERQGKEVEISPEKMRVWRAMGYSEAEARKKEAKYLKK